MKKLHIKCQECGHVTIVNLDIMKMEDILTNDELSKLKKAFETTELRK